MPPTPPTAADLDRLRRLITTMRRDVRRVFERHRYDDVPLDAIGRELGIGTDAVERLLAEAMLHLSHPHP